MEIKNSNQLLAARLLGCYHGLFTLTFSNCWPWREDVEGTKRCLLPTSDGLERSLKKKERKDSGGINYFRDLPRTCPDALAAFDLTSSVLRSFDSYTWQLRIHFLILPRSPFDGAEAYSDQQPQDQQLDFELNAVRNYCSLYLFLSCNWVASFTQRISLLE